MKKLWQKNYKQHKFAEVFCFGDTVVLDNQLITHDVLGSIAHANMLHHIGLLTLHEYRQLKKVLLEIIDLKKSGEFSIQPGDEDVHSKVEQYLTLKLGTLGKKIHTARSRNDQVLVDLRLYSKESMFTIALKTVELINALIVFAKKYEFVPMPGYTHMQKAMPSSLGMWVGSFAESLLDDLAFLNVAYEVNDQSPLGSGAAYGVSLPIDRELTAKLLGFRKVQNNSLYAEVSRGKFHLAVLHALTQLMLTLSRFAEDLLLFTTSEFNFFSIDESLCTGSSIMPQKKNLDVMEAVRARTHAVTHYGQMVASMITGLPSGYNADFGETKFPFMKSIDITVDTVSICKLTVMSTQPNIDVLKDACTPEIFATHAAYELVKKGIPFRDAYKEIGLNIKKLPKFDVNDVIQASAHTGGTGNLNLSALNSKNNVVQSWWNSEKTNYDQTINALKGGE